MEFVERVISKLSNLYYRLILSESDLFYYKLFVKDKAWSAKDPNDDERLRWRQIESLVKQISLNGKNLLILDLGSGRGWLTHLLSRYGEVIGLEPVKIVVRHARKLFPDIKFFVGDLQRYNINFSDKKADLIVLSEVIEHVQDKDKIDLVKDLHRALKNDGYVILTTPRMEILDHLKSSPNQPVEDWLTEDQVFRLFIDNCFKMIDKSRVRMNVGSKELDVYQVWLFQRMQSIDCKTDQ